MSINKNVVKDRKTSQRIDVSSGYNKYEDIPKSVYIDDETARKECAMGLYKTAQAYMKKIKGSCMDDYSGFGTGKVRYGKKFVSVTIYPNAFDGTFSLFYDDVPIPMFQGNQDDTRLALGKIIGHEYADTLFLSIVL